MYQSKSNYDNSKKTIDHVQAYREALKELYKDETDKKKIEFIIGEWRRTQFSSIGERAHLNLILDGELFPKLLNNKEERSEYQKEIADLE